MFFWKVDILDETCQVRCFKPAKNLMLRLASCDWIKKKENTDYAHR